MGIVKELPAPPRQDNRKKILKSFYGLWSKNTRGHKQFDSL